MESVNTFMDASLLMIRTGHSHGSMIGKTARDRLIICAYACGAIDALSQRAGLYDVDIIGAQLGLSAALLKSMGCVIDDETANVAAQAAADDSLTPFRMVGGQAILDFYSQTDIAAPSRLYELLSAPSSETPLDRVVSRLRDKYGPAFDVPAKQTAELKTVAVVHFMLSRALAATAKGRSELSSDERFAFAVACVALSRELAAWAETDPRVVSVVVATKLWMQDMGAGDVGAMARDAIEAFVEMGKNPKGSEAIAALRSTAAQFATTMNEARLRDIATISLGLSRHVRTG